MLYKSLHCIGLKQCKLLFVIFICINNFNIAFNFHFKFKFFNITFILNLYLHFLTSNIRYEIFLIQFHFIQIYIQISHISLFSYIILIYQLKKQLRSLLYTEFLISNSNISSDNANYIYVLFNLILIYCNLL